MYGVLKVLEERGRARRGYFVAGLGAAQFAVPGAVDRLRSLRDDGRSESATSNGASVAVLASTDPAQPYGATLAWPATVGRPARTATSVVVVVNGRPQAWFDRGAHHLVTFDAPSHPGDRVDQPVEQWADALAELVRSGRESSIEVRKANGEAPTAQVRAQLLAAGFVDGYRGLTIRR